MFVQIEKDYQEAVKKAAIEGKEYPNIDDIANNYPGNKAAEEAVKQYAMQIQPNDLEKICKKYFTALLIQKKALDESLQATISGYSGTGLATG